MDSTINLDDSIKEVIKKDKVVNVTLDKEEIKNYVKDDLLFFDSNIEGNIYKYYVLKFEKDFFHVDCASIIDPLKSIKDKLNELVNRDYSEYKDTKTTDSYNNLIDRVNNNGSINNINISSSDGNKFNLSFSEYLKLRINNTTFNHQYIYVAYMVNGQTYTQKYKKSWGKLELALTIVKYQC